MPPEEHKLKPHAIDCYLIHQPGVHAVWSWWFVTGCDLYDSKDPKAYGQEPAQKRAQDVTHEFICFALNPEVFKGEVPPAGWDSTADIAPNRVTAHTLQPQEFIQQVKLRDSEQANEVMRLFVKAVCDGLTAADADFRSRNKQMIVATAAHFLQGKHDLS